MSFSDEAPSSSPRFCEELAVPEAGATDLLHTEVGVWRGWQAGPCLGTVMPIPRGICEAKNTRAPVVRSRSPSSTFK